MLDTDPDIDKLSADFERLDAEARERLGRDGVPDEKMRLLHAADCRYVGQGYELRVEMPAGKLDDDVMKAFTEEFHRIHEEEYGHVFPGNPIQIVNIRVIALGETPKLPRLPSPGEGREEGSTIDESPVLFRVNGDVESYATTFSRRDRLPVGAQIDGPSILVQFDSTIVVPPDASAEVLPTGDVLVQV